MKHLLSTLGLFLFIIGAKAQLPARPDTSSVGLWGAHHFLWFTGHWTVSGNKRKFIVDKGGGDNTPPSGGTITLNPDGSISLNNNSTDTWNKKMDQALQSEQQYLQDLQNPGDNLDPTTHQLREMLEPDAQERVQELKDAKIDPKQDVLGSGSKPAAPARTLADVVAEGCKGVRNDYDMVMNYYKTQVKGHMNDLNVPPPPTMDYDCYACDSNLRKNYDTTIAHYMRDFVHPEDSMIRKGFSILHDFALVGIEAGKGFDEDYGDIFHISKSDPSKSGACSFLDVGALSEAALQITEHLYLRADKLVRVNKKNYKAAEPIVRTYMSVARDWALISGRDESDNVFPLIMDIVNGAVEHYLDEFRHNDWRQIGNLTWMMNLLRDQALLGVKNDGTAMDYLNQLMKIWNGFKLTIEMDVKIGQDAAYKLAHLKGDCHIIPSFQRDSDQCYKWVVADENFQDILGFIKPKGLQSIDVNLLANQVVSPPQVPRITYTGTKKYTAQLMNLSMDFCNPGHDTIVLSGFSPYPAGTGTWLYPGNFVTTEGVNGMEQYFEDIQAKKKLADDGSAKQAEADLQAKAQQLKAQMDALKAQMGSGQPGANYEKMMEFQKNMMSQLSTPTIAKLLWLDFILQVKNNDPVLVDASYNAKEINPAESKVIMYGYYKIHIENDGNGKPKPKK